MKITDDWQTFISYLPEYDEAAHATHVTMVVSVIACLITFGLSVWSFVVARTPTVTGSNVRNVRLIIVAIAFLAIALISSVSLAVNWLKDSSTENIMFTRTAVVESVDPSTSTLIVTAPEEDRKNGWKTKTFVVSEGQTVNTFSQGDTVVLIRRNTRPLDGAHDLNRVYPVDSDTVYAMPFLNRAAGEIDKHRNLDTHDDTPLSERAKKTPDAQNWHTPTVEEVIDHHLSTH